MTYLEAAISVLERAGAPLHYREITRRALDAGLIDTKGKTPEATMGAQLYMAVKQAAGAGETSPFRLSERGQFGLATDVVKGSLSHDIEAHNAKVEADLIEFLHQMHPRQVELLVAQLLTAIGFEDVVVTRYSGDGGIDVDAVLTVGGVTRVKTAIQVKRWRNNVPGSTVRELRGGLMTDQRGLIITTSGFTKDAQMESGALGKTSISLIDGKRLVQLLVEKQVGVRRRPVQLLELNLGELLAEQEEEERSARSAVLWPLPGGQQHFFETLLAFVDHIGAGNLTLHEVTTWVMSRFPKVTKQAVVQSYLRSVLYSMGLIDFDGDRVILSSRGQVFVQTRTRGDLLMVLRENILGVDEILETLRGGPSDLAALRVMLMQRLQVTWETEHQVRHRMQWLVSCGAVQRMGASYTLADFDATAPTG